MGFAMKAQNVSHGGVPASVGIDLGTCYSRVAVWQDGDVLLIPNERGRLATPSCVAFGDSGVLVGEAAVDQADDNLANTHWGPQRLVGDKWTNPWVQWHMRQWPDGVVRGEDDKPLIRVVDRGKERLVRPEEIVTYLLAHLRKNAEKFLGVTVMDAVLTVPARYGKCQQEAILAACRGARLNVLQLVKSPTASAIAYCLTNRRTQRRTVLVCNMGGSYFDFALLRIEDGHILERAVGTDFVDLDNSLLRFCTRELWEKNHINLVARSKVANQRLRRACEMAKRKLSQFHQARIEIRGIIEGKDYSCNISRPHFEDLCKDDIGNVLDSITYCLEDAGMEKAEIHDIVLVGGSARVPMLRRSIREFFYGKVPREVLRPDHAAVLGAAAYAAALAGDSSSESIGLSRAGPKVAPEELRHLSVTQVTNWTTLPREKTVDVEDDVGEDEECHGHLGLRLARPSSFATRAAPRREDEPEARAAAHGSLNSPSSSSTTTATAGDQHGGSNGYGTGTGNGVSGGGRQAQSNCDTANVVARLPVRGPEVAKSGSNVGMSNGSVLPPAKPALPGSLKGPQHHQPLDGLGLDIPGGDSGAEDGPEDVPAPEEKPAIASAESAIVKDVATVTPLVKEAAEAAPSAEVTAVVDDPWAAPDEDEIALCPETPLSTGLTPRRPLNLRAASGSNSSSGYVPWTPGQGSSAAAISLYAGPDEALGSDGKTLSEEITSEGSPAAI